jgi:hypothetical protein
MGFDSKGPIQLTAPQDDHRLAWRFDDACLGQGSRANLVSRSEIVQPVKVNRFVVHLKDIGEASLVRQAPHQGQLATFKVGTHTPASAGILSLGAPASGFSLAGGDPAPYSSFLLLGSLSGTQLV